ncbi:MAG TPA: SPFH domain-containing protein [Anaerolineaceae bacterium]|nr:SPFH domain-containing protein [Anaerolineaceae bacterium]
MNINVIFSGLATILWIIFFGLIALAAVRSSRGERVSPSTRTNIIIAGVLALLSTFTSAGLVFIQPNERGVVISAVAPGGYRSKALEPGVHWIIPFLETVQRYPISKQTYTMSGTATEGQVSGDDSISARTADGQQIFVDASVIYQVDPDKVVNLHIKWQDRYQDSLVRPQARGIIYDMVSKYKVEEVISSKRDEMSQRISGELSQKFEENGLQLVDFVLRNITFSSEYAASVEQKQIADQQAQQAKLVVEQRKQEAEQARQVAQGAADAIVIRAKGDADARVIQAEAEAKALETINQALKGNNELLTYQYINKLSPNVQVMYLPSNSPFIFPLPQTQTVTGSPTAASTPTAVPTAVPTAAPTAKP